MRKAVIIFIILSLTASCFGDIFTSHLKPKVDSSLDIGTSSLLWRFVYTDAITDNTALWQNSNLSGFGIISGTTLTDTVLSINSGSITSGINGTFTGTLTAGTLTDSTFSITGGVGIGLVSLTDGTASWLSNSLSGFVSISGTTLTDGVATITGGTGTFSQIIDNGLTADKVVFTDSSKQLTSTAITTGDGVFWNRVGTTLTTVTSNDDVVLDNDLQVGGITLLVGNVRVGSITAPDRTWALTGEAKITGALTDGSDVVSITGIQGSSGNAGQSMSITLGRLCLFLQNHHFWLTKHCQKPHQTRL